MSMVRLVPGSGWLRDFCCSLLIFAVSGQVFASNATSASIDTVLQERLQSLVAAYPGHVALYARQLNTGKFVALDASKPVQTASVIKLAILYEAMEQIRDGRARWDEGITLRSQDAVSGSGLLSFFDAPLTLTLKDVLTMMIIVSDNTATNLAIDRFGVDAVNARMTQVGLENTHLYKKIGKPAVGAMPADQPKFGLGKTTAGEMEMLMERIALCQLDRPGAALTSAAMIAGDTALCGTALTMLRNQFYRETIPRYLESQDATETGVGIASKTGSLDAVRNDVAIVAGKNGPMVLSIFTYENADKSWTVDNAGELLIARLAREIVHTWSPDGIDGRLLVPGLGMRHSGTPSDASVLPASKK